MTGSQPGGAAVTPIGVDGRMAPAGPLGALRPAVPQPDEVHVWVVRGTDPTPFGPLLDPEEQRRAARFLSARHRDQYIVAHGVLRRLLGAYLRCDPAAIRFVAGRHGKPALADAAAGLAFNLSHAADGVAVAVTAGPAVGIDLEAVRPTSDRDAVVRRLFSTAEQRVFFALPEPQQEAVFWRLWTRNEAFVKAIGLGLSYPLTAFTVGVREPVTLDAPDVPEPAGWSVHHLDPEQGFVGAVAVRHPAPRLRGGVLQREA